jgi:hypothetical protein
MAFIEKTLKNNVNPMEIFFPINIEIIFRR